jgi:hypothetical protein
MRRLERWRPLLVGGVAAGWATEHSDIRLELVADDPKAVELNLVNEGVRYAAQPARGREGVDAAGTELLIESAQARVRLSILSPTLRRSRPRRDEEPRLDALEVAALLAQD